MHLWFATGKFEGLKKELTFILLRAVSNEIFFSYDFDSDKAAILYSTSKRKFQTHLSQPPLKNTILKLLMRGEKDEFSSLFYYLPSITDRKEEVNEHHGNVNLSPVDCSLSLSFCY